MTQSLRREGFEDERPYEAGFLDGYLGLSKSPLAAHRAFQDGHPTLYAWDQDYLSAYRTGQKAHQQKISQRAERLKSREDSPSPTSPHNPFGVLTQPHCNPPNNPPETSNLTRLGPEDGSPEVRQDTPTLLTSAIGHGAVDRAKPALTPWDASWERVQWSAWRRYANLARDAREHWDEERPRRAELALIELRGRKGGCR